MFKFNFKVDEEDRSEEFKDDSNECEKISNTEESEKLVWLESKEHFISENHQDRLMDFKFFEEFIVGNSKVIKLLDEGEISASVVGEEETLMGTLHSDLIRGVYEGGLKIWECARDLSEYVEGMEHKEEGFGGSSVLELGCGAGLPGLVLLSREAAQVDFQDYNPQVIDYYTIPNVLLNHPEAKNSRFFSGDWESLISTVALDKKYDIILTSETIYNIESQEKLIRVFDGLLSNDGYVLLASKIHYFGVGGGLRQFEERLKDKWIYSTVKTYNDTGIQREIIKIRRKNP